MAMDVSALAASADRLRQALEASRTPVGAGLVSNGPAPVPRELAQAFARLMEAPPASSVTPTQGADGVAAIDPSQQLSGVTQSDGVTPIEPSGSVTENTPLTPEQLLQLQFEMGGLVMKERFGLATNTGVIQNFEQTLKAQS